MKYTHLLIVSAVCLIATGFLSAELSRPEGILDRAFDNYPAGATDLIRSADTTITRTKIQVQPLSPSSGTDWSKIYPPEMVVLLDYSSLLERLERLEEENQSLRNEIEVLRSQIQPEKDGEQDVGDNPIYAPGEER